MTSSGDSYIELPAAETGGDRAPTEQAARPDRHEGKAAPSQPGDSRPPGYGPARERIEEKRRQTYAVTDRLARAVERVELAEDRLLRTAGMRR